MLKGEDLELESSPAPTRRDNVIDNIIITISTILQRHEDGSHAGHAMPAWRETSMDSGTDGAFCRDSRCKVRLLLAWHSAAENVKDFAADEVFSRLRWTAAHRRVS